MTLCLGCFRSIDDVQRITRELPRLCASADHAGIDLRRGNGTAQLRTIISIDSVLYPLTGIARYSLELARHLPACTEICDQKLFFFTQFVDALPVPSASPSVWGKLRSQAVKSRIAVATYQKIAPLLQARALRSYSNYVFHGTNFCLPPHSGPSVVTFHDNSIYARPQDHPAERVRYMRHEMELSLRRAQMIVTDSEFTRVEVAKYFSWPLERICSVPLACSSAFAPRPMADMIPTLARYGLRPNHYTLFLGTIEPRKNLGTLLDAYRQLPQELRLRWPLVLAGFSGWHNDNLRTQIESAARAGWLRYLGYVAEDVLPTLLAGARVFAYPSLYEGFGLPVLEAMASGVPVVCSNATSLPEVVGHASLLHDPNDVDELTQLLARALQDEALRSHISALGLARSAQFSWTQTAAQTVAVYGRAATL